MFPSNEQATAEIDAYRPGPRQAVAERPKTDQQFKADAGKAMPDLFETGFANSIRLVQATLEYGAKKYEPHSWRHVPDGLNRYIRAGGRHRQDRVREQLDLNDPVKATLYSRDKESGLPHIAHEMFNIMAQFELALQAEAAANDMSKSELADLLVASMKHPPTDHKGGMAEPSRPSFVDITEDHRIVPL